MHAQHGNTARHVLEFAVRFEPLKHPANFFGKSHPVERGIVFYEGSNLFKFFEREVPSTVSDHDVSNGLESLCRRSSSISQGRNPDKSSGAWPLFSAQAVRYDLNQ